jgi:hypothetical protein
LKSHTYSDKIYANIYHLEVKALNAKSSAASRMFREKSVKNELPGVKAAAYAKLNRFMEKLNPKCKDPEGIKILNC